MEEQPVKAISVVAANNKREVLEFRIRPGDVHEAHIVVKVGFGKR